MKEKAEGRTGKAAKASAKPAPAAKTVDTNQAPKRSWFETFNGPAVMRSIVLGHPITQKFFERYFEYTSRNAHYVSVFARATLGDDKVKEPEDMIDKKVKSVTEFFTNQVAAAKAVIADAKISSMADYRNPKQIETTVVSRNAKFFLDMILCADEYLRYLNTLWLNGEIDDAERSRRELELKTNLRRAMATIRTVCQTLRNQYEKRKTAGAIAPDAAAEKGMAEVAAAVAEADDEEPAEAPVAIAA